MRLAHYAIALGLALGPIELGCGSDNCLDVTAEPLVKLTIIDALSGEKICDAQVDTDLGWQVSKNSLDCSYAIAIEEQGATITITAQKAFYQTATKVVGTDYELDSCGQPIHIVTSMQMAPL
jgi:hypothetical protein